MRKNYMMRAASALLVAVLITTSTISGTFAKYVTTSTAKDEARVAKWGVELQIVGNLFGEAYTDAIAKENAEDVTVQSVNVVTTDDQADDEDIVAPGTKNAEGFAFSINGQPEVAGEITSKLTVQNIYLKKGEYGVMVKIPAGVVTADNFAEFTEEDHLYYSIDNGANFTKATAWDDAWDTDDDEFGFYTLEDYVNLIVDYYPVVFTLDGKLTGNHYEDSLVKIAEIITGKLKLDNSVVNAGKVTYTGTDAVKFDPNTNLEGLLDLDAEKITWEWAFEREGDVKDMYNGADTILGNLFAGGPKVVKLTGDTATAPEAAAGEDVNDYCLNVMFDLEITVSQVN